ncbi:MAG: glycosyltransferase family 4 protein [Spirochaetota bacterium]
MKNNVAKKTAKKAAKAPAGKPAGKTALKKSAVKKGKKKILIVNYEFPPLGGGGGVASYDLAVEWAKTCQVDVLTSSFSDLPLVDKVEGINIFRVKVLGRKSRDAASFISMLTFLTAGFFKGCSLMRKNRYDLINTHFAVPCGPLGYIFGKTFHVPNVLSLHGGDIYDPSKKSSPHRSFFFRRVVRFVLTHADRIVAQSGNTRENAIKYYNPLKPIDIIPLAYHAPKPYKKADRAQLGLDRKDFVCVAIGRIVRRKAYDVLIKALAGIKDQRVKLVLVGDGPERANLEDLTNYLGLSKRVIFTGFVSDEQKYQYLSNADLFTLTSLHEGFGIVFMEAMHCGLPIVCTNYGGQTDFLFHEKNALLLDVGDVEACAAHIERFIADKKLYKLCCANNKKDLKKFAAETVAGRYMGIFKELESGKKK